MPPKPQQITGYSSDATELAERMLLEVWSRLGDFHKYLVLVGGLAPRYIVPQGRASNASVPLHCGTMDVDLEISLAVANLRTYSSIRDTLVENLGFQPGLGRIGNPQRHLSMERAKVLEGRLGENPPSALGYWLVTGYWQWQGSGDHKAVGAGVNRRLSVGFP